MKRPQRRNEQAYEASDMLPRHVGYSAAALFLGIAISAGLVAALVGVLQSNYGNQTTTALDASPITPPWPRLEIDAKADRATVETAAARKLEGYAWVDRAAGTARIPIERAMQLLVTEGWPPPAKSGP